MAGEFWRVRGPAGRPLFSSFYAGSTRIKNANTLTRTPNVFLHTATWTKEVPTGSWPTPVYLRNSAIPALPGWTRGRGVRCGEGTCRRPVVVEPEQTNKAETAGIFEVREAFIESKRQPDTSKESNNDTYFRCAFSDVFHGGWSAAVIPETPPEYHQVSMYSYGILSFNCSFIRDDTILEDHYEKITASTPSGPPSDDGYERCPETCRTRRQVRASINP